MKSNKFYNKVSLTGFIIFWNCLFSFSQYPIDSRIRASSVIINSNLGMGTGFFLIDTSSKYLYLATASHVLITPSGISHLPDTIFITGYRENVDTDTTYKFYVSLTECIKSGNFKYDQKNDVAIIRFAKTTLKGKSLLNQYPTFVGKLSKETKIESWPTHLSVPIEDIIPGSDLFIIGFPQSLGLKGNFDMNRPLMRKGIIAGKDLIKNRIIGDGAVYFGNSGGIAVVGQFKNNHFQLSLAGLISEFVSFDDILYDNRRIPRSVDYKNSGYSVIIPSNSILSLIEQFQK